MNWEAYVPAEMVPWALGGAAFAAGAAFGALAAYALLKPRLAAARARMEERDRQLVRTEAVLGQNERRMQDALGRGFAETQAALRGVAAQVLQTQSSALRAANRESLSDVLQPLQEGMAAYSREIRAAREKGIEMQSRLEAALAGAVADMKARSEAIGKEANALAEAFRGQNKTQGNWGEMVLDGILDGMGLQEGVHYRRQAAVRGADGARTGDGTLIPDVVLVYADGREMALDSKVSLVAFADFVNADPADKAARGEALKRHVAAVKGQIDSLAKKDYPGALRKAGKTAADHVVMFLPNEAAFHVLLEREPGLWAAAFRKRVLLVSPLLLPPLLQLVRMGWLQLEQDRNQVKILAVAGQLVERLEQFYGHLGAVGDSLRQAQDSFVQAVRKLRDGPQNVIRKGEELKRLGVQVEKNRPLPEALREEEEGDGKEPGVP